MKNKRPACGEADLKTQLHNTTDREKMQMEIGGRMYPVAGQVETKSGLAVPLVDIRQMSDQRWMELANTPEQADRRKEVWK